MSSEMNQPVKPPSHKSFQLGAVRFSSEFDSGNLSFVQKASSMAYDVWIGTDHPQNNYRTWFYFWVEGIGRGSTITFNVKNMHNQTRLLSEGLVPVYRNEGSTTWKRIAHRINTLNMVPPKVSQGFNSDGLLEFSFKHTFDGDGRVWLAFFYPWSTEDNNQLLLNLQQQAKNMPDVYFHRTTLALSFENRPIQLVTISSNSHITKQEEHIDDRVLFPNRVRPRMFAPAKRGIFISARVHPGEVPSSHVMNGILKGLLKDTEVARVLREKFVFYLVPIINPDGVFRGHYRTDKNGVNLNRYYINPNPKDHSPIYAIKKFILHLHNSKRFFACLDMHAHASRKGAFIYGNYSTELKKQLEICLFPKLLSMNSKNFEYEGSNFTEKNMYCKDRADSISKEGAARVALFKITKNPYCWTLECNYNMGRYENQLCQPNIQRLPVPVEDKFDKDLITNYQYLDPTEAKDFYTIETYENLGEEILDSFLDLIEAHPFSRVNNPNSRFRSIQNLKLNLLVALMKMVPYHFESPYRKLLLAVASEKQEFCTRAIRALYEIFIRNKPIDNLDEFLKNDPPPLKQLPKLPSSRLPAIREGSTSLVRRKTFDEVENRPAPVNLPDDNDQNQLDSDESPQQIGSTNETVEGTTISSPTSKVKVITRKSTLVRSVDKQQFEVKTRLREYIERLSYNQNVDEAISLASIPTLKVVNLKMMKKSRHHQQTIEIVTSSSRQPTKSLLFNRRGLPEREVSSGMRRASKLITDSLGVS